MNANTVIANGQPVPLAASMNLEAFLASLGFHPRSVVVEHNGEAVAPSEFPHRTLRPGDRIEIVRVAAGG